MSARVPQSYIEINAADAAARKIKDGDMVEVTFGDAAPVRARAHVNGLAPQGSVLLPRHLAGTAAPMTIAAGEVRKVEG